MGKSGLPMISLFMSWLEDTAHVERAKKGLLQAEPVILNGNLRAGAPVIFIRALPHNRLPPRPLHVVLCDTTRMWSVLPSVSSQHGPPHLFSSCHPPHHCSWGIALHWCGRQTGVWQNLHNLANFCRNVGPYPSHSKLWMHLITDWGSRSRPASLEQVVYVDSIGASVNMYSSLKTVPKLSLLPLHKTKQGTRHCTLSFSLLATLLACSQHHKVILQGVQFQAFIGTVKPRWSIPDVEAEKLWHSLTGC